MFRQLTCKHVVLALLTARGTAVLPSAGAAQTIGSVPAVAITTYPALADQVIPADVNKDGKIDLIGGHFQSPSSTTEDVILLKGNGNGTFATAVTIATRLAPLAVADFNKDGNADVLARGTAFYVIPGHGDGTFGAPVAAVTPNTASSFTFAKVADFDGNGTLDIAAITDNDSLDLYSGRGDLTFSAAVSYPTDFAPVDLAAADVDGDGTPDLAVSASDGYKVDVYLNHGGFVFGMTVIRLDRHPLGITVTDVTGDGKRDLVVGVANEELLGQTFTDGFVYVLNGNG